MQSNTTHASQIDEHLPRFWLLLRHGQGNSMNESNFFCRIFERCKTSNQSKPKRLECEKKDEIIIKQRFPHFFAVCTRSPRAFLAQFFAYVLGCAKSYTIQITKLKTRQIIKQQQQQITSSTNSESQNEESSFCIKTSDCCIISFVFSCLCILYMCVFMV